MSAAQIWFCGFSPSLLIALIGRVLFLLRLVGILVPTKAAQVLEIAGFGTLVIYFIFQGKIDNPTTTILYVVFSAVSLLLTVVDDKYYLYIEEAAEDENDDETAH